MDAQEALVTATALSLYAYNVPPVERAQAIWEHFDGECADMRDLVRTMAHPQYAATELAAPSALIYVQQALKRYQHEARKRVEVNLGFRQTVSP